MKETRREWLKNGADSALALSTLSVAGCGAGETQPSGESGLQMIPLDYGRSFICHEAPENSVRFWIESRTRILDEKRGSFTDYYQCGSCKSEDTFAETNLLKEENYDFLPIFGDGQILIFRRHAFVGQRYRNITSSEDILWGPPRLVLKQADRVKELVGYDQIHQATAAATPIVTHTDLWNSEQGLRAIIECPTKTMNINQSKRVYQVDTGPVAYPDLSRRHDPEIGALSLAFVVFNAAGFADFVVEQPTPLEKDPENCQVFHYSQPFSKTAKNRLFTLLV